MPLRPNPAYHADVDDLAVGLLDLLELRHEVPEARLGHNGVGRKDAHPVQLRRRVRLGGQVAPDDLVFLEPTLSAALAKRSLA